MMLRQSVPEPRVRTATRLHRLLASWLTFCSKRTWLPLLLLFGLWIAAIIPTLRLELHTDMAELLPDEHPAVVALRRLAGRQKSSTNLALLFESPDPAANLRFAAATKPALEKLVPQVFSDIEWSPDRSVPDYTTRWKWLYVDKEDLDAAEQLLDRIAASRSSPLMIDLEGDAEEELKKLRARLDEKIPSAANTSAANPSSANPKGGSGTTPTPAAPIASPRDHFIGQEGGKHSLGVMLWRRGDGLASLGDRESVAAVRAVVAQLAPTSFHPQMTVYLSGPIAMAIDEHDAIRSDLTLATAVCTSLVMLVIFLHFRRWALLWVIGAPAVLGLFLALALAQLSIHYLNANTAFLISIILGNGINTPIILLARYGEERRAGVGVQSALLTAMTSTLAATATATAGASIAYGSLLFTSFRGFNQFGLVGGAGMLLVWLVTFLLVPPMVLLGERIRPGCMTPKSSLLGTPFRGLAALCIRRPAVTLVIAGGLLLAVLPSLRAYLHDPVEWNFANLRNRETETQRSWAKMYAIGMGNVGAGHIATDAVLLVDDPAQAEAVAEALRSKDRALPPQRHIIKEVRTLRTFLPNQQEAKLAILTRLRQKIDKHRHLLSDGEWQELEPFRPPDHLRPLTVNDLPTRVLESFTEVDGQRGRLIGIDAENFQDWDGHDLLRLAEALRVEALGKTWVAASTGTVFGGMIEAIVHDGPRVTLAALVGVSLLALCSFGLRGSLPVLSSLFLGLGWLGGLLCLLKLKLNFVNFVALPITLGVGMDYASNIWSRFGKEDRPDIVAVIGETGTAVALCSLTTIIGYSSLLLANNRALQTFGLIADLGELTCLLAALLVLPAWVRLRRKSVAKP
jgi:predicted RND superfamily exporter protein